MIRLDTKKMATHGMNIRSSLYSFLCVFFVFVFLVFFVEPFLCTNENFPTSEASVIFIIIGFIIIRPSHDLHTTFIRPSHDLHTTFIGPSYDLHTTFIPPSHDFHTTFIRPSYDLHTT